PIVSGGYCAATVRGKGHSEYEIRVPHEAADFLARRHVPEAQGLVIAAGQEFTAVFGESKGTDPGRVPHEVPDFAGGQRLRPRRLGPGLPRLLEPFLIRRCLLPAFIGWPRADEVHVGAEVLLAFGRLVAGTVAANAEVFGGSFSGALDSLVKRSP